MKYLKKFKIFESTGQDTINIGGFELKIYPDKKDKNFFYLEPLNNDGKGLYKYNFNIIKKELNELGFKSVEEIEPGVISVIGNINKIKGQGNKLHSDKLSRHILSKYVPMAMNKIGEIDEDDVDTDEMVNYYDRVISLAIDDYIEKEEPSKSDDFEYIDTLFDDLKMFWSPI
jgi:hypothetical protein